MSSVLMQPIQIGTMELKNRIVMAPMGVTIGNMSQGTVEYFVERAKGGAGMVFCNIKASLTFESGDHSIFFCEATEPLFRQLVERCHEYGCKVAAQIQPGDGRIGGPSTKYRVPISASDCPWMHAPKYPCHGLTVEEIKILQDDFRASARAAVRCGADCIEIHGYGGYLTDQFLTARWNTRTDEYGGSVEKRARFVKELIEICKEEGGADYPVLVKFTPDHYMDEPGYRKMEEGLELAKLFVSYGVDALHVDAGCHENWYRAMPPMALREIMQYESVRRVKEVVDVPVFTNGKLGDVETAERLVAEGVMDMAAIGRGLLADPDLPNKVLEGKRDEIRPCISCNAGCIGRVFAGAAASCAINPRCGREIDPALRTDVPKRLLVVGGGIGGCAAALFAKEAGHDVTLWEQSDRLGGKLHAAAAPSFKAELKDLIIYYEGALQRAEVPIVFGKKADRGSVAEFAPDAVIWAAGCTDRVPEVPGLDSVSVCTAAQALEGAPVGENVIVLGGGVTGIETALHFAQVGKTVTCIARRKLPSKPEFKMNDMILRKMMAESTAEFLDFTEIAEIKDGIATLRGKTDTKQIPCDTVILSLGGDGTQCDFADLVPVTVIGDALGAGNVLQAVHTAYEAIRGL